METFEPNKGNEEISKRWEEAKVSEAKDSGDKDNNRYVLDMFPYPSGDGLHVGHVESYTGSDILARYYRMKGYNVLHPIGWDAFGLPAENYAIKKGVHPQESTKTNIENFTRQIKSLGFSYDWSREINTSDPSFYRWTQWLFLKLYERGLAYRKKAGANWCESCQTVLANEQVVDGKCERCGSEVVQKKMEQWFFKITDYADKLLEDLEKVDWPENIKEMQRNWIGRSEGAEVDFDVILNGATRNEKPDLYIDPSVDSNLSQDDKACNTERSEESDSIKVFTTRPDTLFGVTYIVLAPEHPLVSNVTTVKQQEEVEDYQACAASKSQLQRTDLEREKTGVFTGGYALHPITGKEIPIWVADYVIEEYGGGAVMAVPAHDQRDFEFAKKYNLPIIEVVSSENNIDDMAYTGAGSLINSEEFNGMSSLDAKKKISEKIGAEWKVTYRLRDWLVSRQRYWGAPIPIIYCSKCLEKIKNQKSKIKINKCFQHESISPITNHQSPITSNTQTAVINEKEYAIIPVAEKDLPVELPDDVDFRPTGESPLAKSKSFHNVKCPVCGGEAIRESDTMDTFVCSSWYYLRYLNSNDNNKPFTEESVKNWMPVDIYIGGAEHAVLHLLYARFITKALVDAGEIIFMDGTNEPFKSLRNQGLILGPDGQKMSKSRGNVINPDEIVENYGADALRLYEMFLGPFEQTKNWNTQGIEGVVRFLKKLVTFYENAQPNADNNHRLRNTIELTRDIPKKIERLHFNTAVSAFMEWLNAITKKGATYSSDDLKIFIKLLSPFAPFTAEILWKIVGEKGLVAENEWPSVGGFVADDKRLIIIQVNGKTRGSIEVDSSMDNKEIIARAKKAHNVLKYIKDKNIKKEIVVPGRLVNFVTRDK